MKFSSTLEFNAVREWFDQYIAYEKLKEMMYDIEQSAAISWRSAAKIDEELPLLLESPAATEKEQQFIQFLKKEINRISDFYRLKEYEFLNELSLLQENAKQYQTPDGSLSSNIDYPIRDDLKSKSRDLYINLCSLKDFVVLNYTGFSKILKKHDKVLGTCLKPTIMPLVEESYFWQQNSDSIRSANINELIQRTVSLYSFFTGDANAERAATELGHYLREFVVWERNTIWRDMIAKERKATSAGVMRISDTSIKGFHLRLPFVGVVVINYSFISFLFCMAVFILLLNTSPFEDSSKSKCLAILIFVSMLWAMEVFPLYVTSMIIPVLIVLLRVLSRDGKPLTSQQATSVIIGQMFSPVIFLLLGGFTIAGALSKYHVAKGLATMILSHAGTASRTILLTIMFVATFSSMWLSNVAAPVLCFSVIDPILRTLEPGNLFAKSLIMGIALASNIGGMVTPISSPQNAIALENMVSPISWISWLSITLPIAIFSNIICWLSLLLIYNPTKDTPRVNPIRATKKPWSRTQIIVIGISLTTIILWCAESSIRQFVGHSGIIGIFPMVMFFGSGILSKDDFNNFLWTVIMLAMGGTALGFSVKDTELLKDIAVTFKSALDGQDLWMVMFAFCCLVLIAATFISHTVSALIILPLVQSVGEALPGGHANLLVMASAIMCSGAMGLPVSGFPNITAVSMEDSTGKPYVGTKDFLKVGVPMSVIVCLLTVSMGYGIMIIII